MRYSKLEQTGGWVGWRSEFGISERLPAGVSFRSKMPPVNVMRIWHLPLKRKEALNRPPLIFVEKQGALRKKIYSSLQQRTPPRSSGDENAGAEGLPTFHRVPTGGIADIGYHLAHRIKPFGGHPFAGAVP